MINNVEWKGEGDEEGKNLGFAEIWGR